ncbi:MAG: D-2-hydroxyacid dehydrogenase [Synergistaceae bacterium]|jgi:phosphoglycerate dehydrogenase-like enzyme|nr:D-2-hydroxyacid dehydrogenase [Synergistaceae bacterium]
MNEEKIHIHIENSRISHPVFVGTEEHVKALFERNPDIAGKLRVTIGSSAYDEIDRWTKSDFEEYYHCMETADVLVGYSFPTADVAKYAPALRWIHFISSGVEHMAPFGWVPEGVTLVNNRGVHLPKSGESFAMFLGMLNAQIPRLVTAQREGRWDRAFTSVIAGKKLVVFGVGNQGGEVAKQAKRMGLRVVGIDPYVTEHQCCDEIHTADRMKEDLRDADFLAIAAPVTEETKGIFSEEVLSWLPGHAGLMNISRGALLDQNALDRKLRAGELSCAVLDVFDPEPLPPDSPLWTTPNLIITPHVSSDDLVNYMPLTLDLTIENIRNEMAGRPLKNVVDIARAF